MTSLNGFFSRRTQSEHVVEPSDLKDVYDWLIPDLKTTLAGLGDCPTVVAEAVLQLLPFGSRVALSEKKLAQFTHMQTGGSKSPEDGSHPVAITPLGFAVMKYAALQLEADPEGVARRTQDAYDIAFPDRAKVVDCT